MHPSRILPDLQCSLLCEDVRQEANGNFFVTGILSYIRVPQLPITALRLFVFNRWTAGVGQFVEVVRLLAPDQSTVLRQGNPLKFKLDDPAQNMTNVTVLQQIPFAAPGVYSIEVLIEDVMKLRYPLPVVVIPPNRSGGPGTNPPGAAPVAGGAPPPANPGTPPSTP